MRLLLFFIALSVLSCTPQLSRDVEQVYENKKEVVSTFDHLSVFRTGTRSNIFLYTYKDGQKNEYVFVRSQGEIYLYRDSLTFNPDVILKVDKKQNNLSYRKELTTKLKARLKKMDSLAISDVSSDFSGQAVNLKIYMKSRRIMLYVSDPRKITNPEWSKYIKSMQKLNENWYYSETDK